MSDNLMSQLGMQILKPSKTVKLYHSLSREQLCKWFHGSIISISSWPGSNGQFVGSNGMEFHPFPLFNKLTLLEQVSMTWIISKRSFRGHLAKMACNFSLIVIIPCCPAKRTMRSARSLALIMSERILVWGWAASSKSFSNNQSKAYNFLAWINWRYRKKEIFQVLIGIMTIYVKVQLSSRI